MVHLGNPPGGGQLDPGNHAHRAMLREFHVSGADLVFPPKSGGFKEWVEISTRSGFRSKRSGNLATDVFGYFQLSTGKRTLSGWRSSRSRPWDWRWSKCLHACPTPAQFFRRLRVSPRLTERPANSFASVVWSSAMTT